MIKLVVTEKPRSFESFYEEETKDKNNFSFWYPKVKDILTTPLTFYFSVPADIAEVLSDWYECKNNHDKALQFCKTLKNTIDNNLHPVPFIFIKNARYSNKFNFNESCRCRSDVDEIRRHLCQINFDSMCCDALGFTEVVLRDYIPFDENKVPTIYNGMPLRPEYRVFYDFNKKEIKHIHDYWDYNYVRPSLYSKTDQIIFDATKEERELEWRSHFKDIVQECEKLKNVNGLEGIWSVDFLVDNTGKIWMIDMALGHNSAYWNYVFENSEC